MGASVDKLKKYTEQTSRQSTMVGDKKVMMKEVGLTKGSKGFNIDKALELYKYGENNKKALWVSEDMHHELGVFAAVNKIDIGKATELLVKLGLIEHKNTND